MRCTVGEVAELHRREEAAAEIAKLIHEYDHPEYDTCTYCVFCWALAIQLLRDLPPKDLGLVST